jgi:hypothetical protein
MIPFFHGIRWTDTGVRGTRPHRSRSAVPDYQKQICFQKVCMASSTLQESKQAAQLTALAGWSVSMITRLRPASRVQRRARSRRRGGGKPRLARRRCPSRGATTLPSINGNYCAAVERLGIVTGRGRVDLTSALCTEDSVRCPLGGAGYSGFFGTTATWLGVRCLGGRRLGVRLRLCFGRYLVPYLIPVT